VNSGQLARHYGFTDIDGSRPDAWRFIEDTERGVDADPVDYRSLQELPVATAQYRDRCARSRGGVVERSLVHPSGSLVERSSSPIAGQYREPGLGVSVRSDLPLGLTHEDSGDASPSMESRDVDLFNLVVDDHDEARDGTVDNRNCCVADPSSRPVRNESSVRASVNS